MTFISIPACYIITLKYPLDYKVFVPISYLWLLKNKQPNNQPTNQNKNNNNNSNSNNNNNNNKVENIKHKYRTNNRMQGPPAAFTTSYKKRL